MPLMVTKDGNTGERTRTLGVPREAAIAATIAERKQVVQPAAVPPIEKSGEPQQAESAAPPAPPEAAKPDPTHLVEIERRERELQAARHEHELTKRELESLKKSPEDALRALGFTPESFVERWLGTGSGDQQQKPVETAKPQESELERRLKAIEAEREQERAQARARARRQEIESMIPEGEDYEVIHAWKDMGVVDQLMSQIDQMESQRKGGLGPNELKALIGDFEGASRKNVQAQIGRLAKTKWFRSMVSELLNQGEQKAQSAAPPSDVTPPQSAYEAESGYERRSMPLRGRITENLRERAKQEALRRRGIV